MEKSWGNASLIFTHLGFIAMILKMVLKGLHVGWERAFVVGHKHRSVADRDIWVRISLLSLVWIQNQQSLNYYLESGTDPDACTRSFAEVEDLDYLHNIPIFKVWIPWAAVNLCWYLFCLAFSLPGRMGFDCFFKGYCLYSGKTAVSIYLLANKQVPGDISKWNLGLLHFRLDNPVATGRDNTQLSCLLSLFCNSSIGQIVLC